MRTRWYVQIMGAERGPVTDDELRSLAASGQLAAADLVRSASEQSWVRVGDLSELFPVANASESASCSAERLTGEVPDDANAWCSLELQSTDTKASIRWTTPSSATVVNATASNVHKPLVRVPHRTLKVGHAATPTGRAEKRAHQTTVANRVDAESDTIISNDVSSAPQPSSDDSIEHRL